MERLIEATYSAITKLTQYHISYLFLWIFPCMKQKPTNDLILSILLAVIDDGYLFRNRRP